MAGSRRQFLSPWSASPSCCISPIGLRWMRRRSRRASPTHQVGCYLRANILGGQEVFLRNGLMAFGSIFGHGAYLGPDFTADYLRKLATLMRDQYGGLQSDQALARTVADFKTNRYDAASG